MRSILKIIKIGGKTYKIGHTGLLAVDVPAASEKDVIITVKASKEKSPVLSSISVGRIAHLGKKALTAVKLKEAVFSNDTDYIEIIRKGIPKKSIDYLVEATEIPVAEMAEIMDTTPRKLAAIKPNTIIEKSQSEKVLHIARLYALGEEVFGSRDEFNKWMNGRVPALGKKKPKEYLDTATGINLLMDELLRIQHSVYS